MTQRMLIDATHAEESRVAVIDGHRLVEFDHETSTKKQLKGNVYLAKVVRVEPSLQAAFVEYGGNRHGFLAFNEIHPDYYRIPISDREALLAQTNGEEAAESEESKTGESVDTLGGDESDDIAHASAAERRRIVNLTRRYKIQEVIKRRQIMLVQVVKEERGTKGAALTTYLSLAGRYCVLMPNTGKGGGVSRKISSAEQRRRMKSILAELEAPPGMAVILRTAGMERSKAEIKRDYDYLRRLWDEIRERTLKSMAPCLIHEEANIIKRALRDVYGKDITEVLVEGEEAYKTAKSFMKTMLPSHAKRVQHYADETSPLFQKFHIESQLEDIQKPTVKLRSGGYIVLNQTEALVAIDVNSGRATRERNIEETALNTNREAAEEVARQLRLRDLAGLIVIDFIDMEHARNNATVERTLKEAMKNDRARLQVGRISPFGLLEMSRQRLRPSMVEAHNQPCPTCGGAGHVRSTESSALRLLRAIEEEGMRHRGGELSIAVPPAVALYILNHKRAALAAIEQRYGFRVGFTPDEALIAPDFRLQHHAAQPAPEVQQPSPAEVPAILAPAPEMEEAAEEPLAARPEPAPQQPLGGEEGQGRGKRRRRRRGRRGGAPREDLPIAPALVAEEPEAEPFAEGESDIEAEGEAEVVIERPAGSPPVTTHRLDEEEGGRRRRRRGRRGGRRRGRGGRGGEGQQAEQGLGAGAQPDSSGPFPAERETFTPGPFTDAPSSNVPPTVAAMAAIESEPAFVAESPPAPSPDEAVSPRNQRRRAPFEAEPAAESAEPMPSPAPEPEPAPLTHANGDGGGAAEPGTARPRRRGWWNRFLSDGQD